MELLFSLTANMETVVTYTEKKLSWWLADLTKKNPNCEIAITGIHWAFWMGLNIMERINIREKYYSKPL